MKVEEVAVQRCHFLGETDFCIGYGVWMLNCYGKLCIRKVIVI